MKTMRSLGIAGGMIAAALVGGTLISAAAAAPAGSGPSASTPVSDETDASAYCDTWREAFAAELGVDVADLTPAGKVATIAAIEAAVANGDLPADVAERMKERVQAADGDGCRLLGAGFRAWGRHAAIADWRIDWVSAAADALGMAPADLVSALRDGDSLKQISQEQKVDYDVVSQAILDAATADLQALVDAGTITQEQADLRLDRLELALQSNAFPPLGNGIHRGPHLGGRGQGGNGAGASS
jgi:hypothetical protein